MWLLAIPVVIVAALLYWAGWRKCAYAALLSPLVPVGCYHLTIYTNEHPEFGEHIDKVSWLPAEARNICHVQSYSFTAYEFDISESGFRAYADSMGWPLTAIEGSKMVARYKLGVPAMRDSSQESDLYATASLGMIYELRTPSGGGIVAMYDSEKRRAYVRKSPR